MDSAAGQEWCALDSRKTVMDILDYFLTFNDQICILMMIKNNNNSKLHPLKKILCGETDILIMYTGGVE